MFYAIGKVRNKRGELIRALWVSSDKSYCVFGCRRYNMRSILNQGKTVLYESNGETIEIEFKPSTLKISSMPRIWAPSLLQAKL